jgi:Regulator of chromosome condensation (RCC1) repeat
MPRPAPSTASPRTRRLIVFCISLSISALAAPVRAQPAAWRSVTVGDDHACALDRAGQAYCWGNNHSGQLGARTPVKCGIIGESGARGCYPTPNERPQPAGGAMRFAAISAGRYLTCGIDPEGRAFCWGEPMGDTAAYRDRCLRERACSFTPVPLDPARRFTSLDAPARCAATRGGEALCWGHRFDEAAASTTPWQAAVTLVAGDPRTSATTPTFCALGHDGRAWCRGDAAFGVLGTGGRDSTAAPAPVEGARFSGLAVLGTWVCGVDLENTARCWGAAGYADAGSGGTREGFEVCERWGSRSWCNLRPAPVAFTGPVPLRDRDAARYDAGGRGDGGADRGWRGVRVGWRPRGQALASRAAVGIPLRRRLGPVRGDDERRALLLGPRPAR